MAKIKIGIQGDRGSTNERAAKFFAQKHGWDDFEIVYLISTENVLKALNDGTIDYGTFAWESSRAGLVTETQEAIKKYPYEKIDEEDLQLDHALLGCGPIDKTNTVNIYSHPQALKEHADFLKTQFPKLNLIEEADTGQAAKNLSEGQYPENSLAIASIVCADLFKLEPVIKDLPSNQGYQTKILLAKKK